MLALLLAAAIQPPPAAPIYPVAPTVLVFRTRDYAGKTHPTVTVKCDAGRLRVEGFGRTLVFDGRAWFAESEISEDSAAVAVFEGPLAPGEAVTRDAFGRPILIPLLLAGNRRGRVDYRYDATGLAAANVVFTDGSGYQFRRVSALPGAFSPADFEPPQKVEQPRFTAASSPQKDAPAPDFTAVARLIAIEISAAEQAEFERVGEVGRYRPKAP